MSAPFDVELGGPELLTALATVFWWWVLRRLRGKPWRFAVVSLVGTFLHELAHFVVGAVTGAKPVSFRIFPQRTEQGWTLGSVTFENMTLFNAAPVALAPLLLLALAPLLGLYWAAPAAQSANWSTWLLATYVCANALDAGWPSSTDIKVGADSALMYGGAATLLWWLWPG